MDSSFVTCNISPDSKVCQVDLSGQILTTGQTRAISRELMTPDLRVDCRLMVVFPVVVLVLENSA